MYRCQVQFYLIGSRRSCLEPIRRIPPLERFTHLFAESEGAERQAAAQADVIFAALQGAEIEETLKRLSAWKKPEAQLILLADQRQVSEAVLPEIQDFWPVPMGERQLGFRFRKWQQDYKQSKDLWEARQFLEACIDSTPNMVWYKDKDGVHEMVNASFCKTVNKPPEQVQGRTHAYIWDVEEDDPACIESEQEVMRTRQTCISEEIVQSGEGQKLLTTYKSPLYDVDGSVMGTVGVAVDVTRERAYQQEIIKKNQTLEMLFATMDCGVMCHSIDGSKVTSINQAALRLLGYETQQQLLEDGFALVAQSVVEEDKKKLRKAIRSLKKVGDSVSTEYRVQHKDGKILHILGNIKLIEENGELFYQRFLLDFTAQKLQEEAKWAQKDQEIQYQEQIFEIFSTYLAENVDDVYIMLDAQGNQIEFVSRNVERVLGVPWQSLKDGVAALGPANYLTGRKPTPEDFDRMEPGAPPVIMETERVNRQTREHKWFRESVYCASVQGKKKIILYISDRTKEKRTQNALSEALDMAQVANKAKNTFLGNVSHDIRTPMNAIMGFLPLLQEEADNPEHVLEYTQKISAASQHLLGLINDVLDMNKIESGSAVLNISELNLAEIIDELNAIIRPQAKAKNQTFEIFAHSLVYEHLLGDRLRINQILLNILSNAVKYTSEGGRIEMQVKELPQVDKAYSRIRFTISDNGQGMSEEYQKVIFDPFTREKNTKLNQVQGTGLGMAITKSLVDLMNGSIRVESELGEGSTFVVELELRIQETQDDPAFWGDHSLARMIIADDDEDICRDIVKKMRETGVDTQYATDGAQAIQMIRSARDEGRPYDLILLDWKMPDLDGLATAKLIRKSYQDKIPILLFTAYDWADIERDALEVGIKHFLPKPFFMSNFKDAIQRMMGDQKELKEDGKSAVEGKRVLVVDDIEVNRMILVKILSSLGACCDTAENGGQAVEKFKRAVQNQEGYDIILMDIQMPVMNGYEATRAIRASGLPEASQVAILAMTANAFVDDIRESLEAGMDAHVSKPIVLDQLKRAIQEVLARKQGGQVDQPAQPAK